MESKRGLDPDAVRDMPCRGIDGKGEYLDTANKEFTIATLRKLVESMLANVENITARHAIRVRFKIRFSIDGDLYRRAANAVGPAAGPTVGGAGGAGPGSGGGGAPSGPQIGGANVPEEPREFFAGPGGPAVVPADLGAQPIPPPGFEDGPWRDLWLDARVTYITLVEGAEFRVSAEEPYKITMNFTYKLGTGQGDVGGRDTPPAVTDDIPAEATPNTVGEDPTVVWPSGE